MTAIATTELNEITVGPGWADQNDEPTAPPVATDSCGGESEGKVETLAKKPTEHFVRLHTEIEALAARENTRYAINGVFIVGRYAAATNGRAAAVAKLRSANGDPRGIIPGQLIKTCPIPEPRIEVDEDGDESEVHPEVDRKFVQVGDHRWGHADDDVQITCDSPVGDFPDVADVMPDLDKDRYAKGAVISLDAALLLATAKAICEQQERGNRVTLFIPTDRTKPIGVLGSEGVAAVMPCSASDDERGRYQAVVASFKKAWSSNN